MTSERARRLAVVTGASSGIGAATARALVQAGWRVVCVARGRDKLADLEAELAGAPGDVLIEALDASDGEAVEAMARRVEEASGVPDLIVNSAGLGQWKAIDETGPGEALAMIRAPYLAAFEVTRAFAAAMLERARGVVIHVGSPASAIALPSATAYMAARFALRGLHEGLCQDFRGTGVRSCHVVFGKVTSDYFRHNPDSEERIPGIARVIRESSPEECARVILRVAERPRRTVLYPFMLRAFYWIHAVAPFLTRWLAWRTGRRLTKASPEPVAE